MQSISLINRAENFFPAYRDVITEGAEFIDYCDFTPNNEVAIRFNIKTRRQPTLDFVALSANEYATESGDQGGSLARFNIAGNHLYAVDNRNLIIFEITNLNSPVDLGNEQVGREIETIFNQDDLLFVCVQGVGLRVFYASARPDLEQIQVFDSVTILDAILQDDKLIMISEVALVQHSFTATGIELLRT